MTGRRGYRDAHTHLSAGACDLADLDVRDVNDGEAIGELVERAALVRARGEWIRGWGFRSQDARLSAILDRAAPDHPVIIVRSDGHAAWVNGAGRHALDVIDPGGRFDEAAFDALRLRLPAPSDAERVALVATRLAELEALGIDSVDDIVEAWGPSVWARLRERGLAASVGLWVPAETPSAEVASLRREFPPGGRPVALRGVKIFLDGTLSARTAALGAPYADAPGRSGALRLNPNEAREAVASWAALGVPVALHAIGDRAVSVALDAFESAGRPSWGAHRIEHAQVLARSDLPRFARAGIVASVQPGHWRDDRSWLDERLGSRAEVLVHPIASFLRAGVGVVFGSDWPVSRWDPEYVIAAACDPARGDEAIDRHEACRLLSA